MTSADVQAKAREYVAAGRLTVTAVTLDRVAATCQGTADEPYRLSWTVWSGWTCSCPATGDCCHLVGLRLVVDLAAVEGPDDDQLPPRPPPPDRDRDGRERAFTDPTDAEDVPPRPPPPETRDAA